MEKKGNKGNKDNVYGKYKECRVGKEEIRGIGYIGDMGYKIGVGNYP